jgi:O-methyltransferase
MPAIPLSRPLEIQSPLETSWYQCVDWQDGTETLGKWDYRRDGGRDYLGRLNYRGKTVIELGPASGYLTKQMALQGAQVTGIEVSDDEPWQIVPRADVDIDAYEEQRARGLNRFRKAWWLTQSRWNTNARMSYIGIGRLYDFADSNRFDIALVASVLQHLENPVRALYAVASMADTVVVSDLIFPRIERTGLAGFAPARNNDITGSWWMMSSGIVNQIMETAGFERANHYTAVYIQRSGEQTRDREFYTSVFERARDIKVKQPRGVR